MVRNKVLKLIFLLLLGVCCCCCQAEGMAKKKDFAMDTARLWSKAVPDLGKVVYLENEYLRVSLVPELGGRIWDLIDKTSGRQIFTRWNGVWCGMTDYTFSGRCVECGWMEMCFSYSIIKDSDEEVAVEVSAVREIAGTTIKLRRIVSLKAGKNALEVKVMCENIGKAAITSFGYGCHPEINREKASKLIIGIPQKNGIRTFPIPFKGGDNVTQFSEGWVASLDPISKKGVALQFPLDELRCIHFYYSETFYNFEYFTKLAPLSPGGMRSCQFSFIPITGWEDVSELEKRE